MIVAAALVLQRAVLRAPFFADDFLFLDQVRHRSLPAALASPDPIGNFLRPVGRQLHFWWLSHAASESATAFHAANLALFALALALLFSLVRSIAGRAAAAIATAFLALHYAADVPLQWASGSQDLLALTLALAAIRLHVSGRRALAAPVYLLAMLSKETVVFTPAIAALLDRGAGDWRARARRAWPLGAAAAVWAAVWIVTAGARPGGAAALAPSAAGVPATLVHLAQVALGLEWHTGGVPALLSTPPPWLALALASIAVVLVSWSPRPGPEPGGPGAVRLGLLWAVLGALPVALVANIWSAYFYLFALCGAALAIGATLARAPREIAIAALALLAWGSQGGRTLDEFATGPGAWTLQSHVNRFYVERSMRFVGRYLESFRRARPTLPHGSTVFFFGLPPSVGFQTADGPVLRWAYRDSSLHSHFLANFTADRAGRGEVFFFRTDDDSLIEEWRDRRPWMDVAITMMLEDRDDVAAEALSVDLARGGADPRTPYYLSWLRWNAGDVAGAARTLRLAGLVPERGPVPEVVAAARHLAAGGDTLAATAMLDRGMSRHALDPEVHAMLADLLLRVDADVAQGGVEAFAARVLAPQDPQAWRRWGTVQLMTRRYPQAERSLARYFTLAGRRADSDEQAKRWMGILEQMHPGTALAQRSIRGGSHSVP